MESAARHTSQTVGEAVALEHAALYLEQHREFVRQHPLVVSTSVALGSCVAWIRIVEVEFRDVGSGVALQLSLTDRSNAGGG